MPRGTGGLTPQIVLTFDSRGSNTMFDPLSSRHGKAQIVQPFN